MRTAGKGSIPDYSCWFADVPRKFVSCGKSSIGGQVNFSSVCKGQSPKAFIATLVLILVTGTALLTTPARAGAVKASFQTSYFDDDCFQRFLRNSRQQRTLFVDHGLQIGPIIALHSSLGYKFLQRHMALLSYQVGRQEYDSDYMIPLCRECIFFFHGLWIGYGHEFYRPLDFGSGFFVNPILWAGSEFVANNGLVTISESGFLMNPAIRPEILFGYYRNKVDFFAGLNYYHWLPMAMTTAGNALVDEQSGEHLKWERELFPGRKGVNFVVGIRYTIR